MNKARVNILVVDDERGLCSGIQEALRREGYTVEAANEAAGALHWTDRRLFNIVLTDVKMPGLDGLELVRRVKSKSPDTLCILMTAYGTVGHAVEAMKEGAYDYLSKPLDMQRLRALVNKALEFQAVVAENHELRSRLERSSEPGALLGESEAMRAVLRLIDEVAQSDATVLIEGQSGTGKELVARAIHLKSKRRDRPFVSVNCAALAEPLLETELFGHAKGAFTGAVSAKPGKFELAHGGTLLLDEVGEMPLGLQPKLLRALQEREVDRLGDTRTIHVDLRVIATTNCALAQMVREGKFRADLYYRLNVIPLSLPPLRERPGDVRELAEFFVRLYAPPGQALHLSPAFLDQLEAHTWPGNVRELANCLRRVVALATGPEIGVNALEACELAPAVSSAASPAAFDISALRPGVSLGEMERKLVEITLVATGGNRSRAAELLGVSLRTVRNKVRSYGLPSCSSYAHD